MNESQTDIPNEKYLEQIWNVLEAEPKISNEDICKAIDPLALRELPRSTAADIFSGRPLRYPPDGAQTWDNLFEQSIISMIDSISRLVRLVLERLIPARGKKGLKAELDLHENLLEIEDDLRRMERKPLWNGGNERARLEYWLNMKIKAHISEE